MGTSHHDIVRIAALGFSDHIVLENILGWRHRDRGYRTGLGQRSSIGKRCTYHRDGGLVGRQRTNNEFLTGRVIALVEDDHRKSTGGEGILGLDGERAGATLNQGNSPGRKACEVASFTAAGAFTTAAPGSSPRR